MARKKPKEPRKRSRAIQGAIYDVAGLATRDGDSQKAIRGRVARGTIPYRRLGGRIIFLADELDAFYKALPGVSATEAVANLAQRDGRA
jgi:hypothetical protein